FLAAAVRWGAVFLGADVAMVSYPLPSSETEADWSQGSRPSVHHCPVRRADRGHTVVGSSSPLDVPRVTVALATVSPPESVRSERATVRTQLQFSRASVRYPAGCRSPPPLTSYRRPRSGAPGPARRRI